MLISLRHHSHSPWYSLSRGTFSNCWFLFALNLVELPSGYVQIAIENGHKNSRFSNWTCWFSTATLVITRGYEPLNWMDVVRHAVDWPSRSSCLFSVGVVSPRTKKEDWNRDPELSSVQFVQPLLVDEFEEFCYQLYYLVIRREQLGAFGVSIFPIYSLFNEEPRSYLELSNHVKGC